MLVLGLETSCDETGVALYDTQAGLLSHQLHSQVALHNAYGGVVPELASRDHVRRALPLIQALLDETKLPLSAVDAIAYTEGPGLAGALLVGASIAMGLGYSLGVPTIGIHHMEGHLLSPLLAEPRPALPFTALLVSGGHTQLVRLTSYSDYRLLGETLDDAAGEAFDKAAKLLGLGYPGGPALAALAVSGNPKRFSLPRPMLTSGDCNFSFSGLKTAVLTLCKQEGLDTQARADLAAGVQEAIADVLVTKSLHAAQMTASTQLVVAGGVGANRRLRELLRSKASERGIEVFFPPIEFCTDNGAMIAFAGALKLQHRKSITPETKLNFGVRPRWALETLREDGTARSA
jgi:N6-L-threonylcarbamoyladenine synthase